MVIKMRKQAISLAALMCCVIPTYFAASVHASGVDNIAARADYLYNIKWTAQKTVKGWKDKYTFYAGNSYRIPYGQPVSSGKYICWGISADDFLTAASNSLSEFYTLRSNYSGNYSTYYAMDCSAFASYCWDLPYRTTTSGWSGLPVTSYGNCTWENIWKIQTGDALNLSGNHVVIISDITYNNGNISEIEITEQTVPEMKRSYLTPSQLVSQYSNYTIYRYNNRDSVSAPPNSVLPSEPEKPEVSSDYFTVDYYDSYVEITNNTDSNKSATVITAYYTDAGVLIDMSSEKINFAGGETYSLEIEGNSKIFLWDSLNGMVPLAKQN